MIVEKSMHSGWLSNSYLVGDHEGGTGVLIDAGGPVMPLIEAVGRHKLTVSHLLVTHSDHDHIAEADTYTSRFDLQVLAHPVEAERMDRVDGMLEDGDEVTAGDLTITALLTPGHSPGHLSFLVNGTDCFTADVLFHGTVGGTMRDSYESLHHSIMDVLMKLPPETPRPPGPHRPDHHRCGVGRERVRAALARRRSCRSRAVHRERPRRDARALRPRLRRRAQRAREVGGRKP